VCRSSILSIRRTRSFSGAINLAPTPEGLVRLSSIVSILSIPVHRVHSVHPVHRVHSVHPRYPMNPRWFEFLRPIRHNHFRLTGLPEQAPALQRWRRGQVIYRHKAVPAPHNKQHAFTLQNMPLAIGQRRAHP